MNKLQVRDALSPLAILNLNLADVIALPDEEASELLNQRMAAIVQIDRLHERSYGERIIITREFERRQLWKHLEDPDTGQPFPHLTAWLSCSDYLGCRRVNFEALHDGKKLADIPADKLIDVPKGNLKVLTQLSTAVRSQPDILEAARKLPQDEFLEKVEKEQPLQHLEMRKPMRFSPGRSWAKTIEQAIAWALEHGIASSRDEALLRMAETALDSWLLEEELKSMPAEEKVDGPHPEN